jgi:hypothetical protein
MTVVTLEEAKSRLEELAGLAAQGECVRIEVSSGVELELRHLSARLPQRNRVGGQWAGRLEVGGKFFEPLPEEWLAEFETGSVFPEDTEARETDRGNAK